MAYTVRLGNVSKRSNSTLQPDTSSWFSAQVTFKLAKDIDTPTFILSMPSLSSYPQYNYLYLVEFNAYYWITDIVSVRADVWEISAAMDVLATYKAAILATSCFVEYGFNADASGAAYRLQDTRQNISMVPTIKTVTKNFLVGEISTSQGCYCMTAVGKSGGVSAYIIAAGPMKELLNAVATDIFDAVDQKQTVEEILKYFSYNSLLQGSAIQAIRSCVWLPVYLTTFNGLGNVVPVYLGDFDTGVNGVSIDNNIVVVRKASVTIPWPTNDWKRMNCQIQVYIPFIGTVAIPINQCNTAKTVDITWCMEPIGGTVSVRVVCGNYTVFVGSASIGAAYAIGSSNVPVQNFVGGVAQAIGGYVEVAAGAADLGAALASPLDDIMGSGAYSKAASGILSGVTNAVSGVTQSITPIVQCAGSMSGASACGQSMDIELSLFYYPPIDDSGFQSVYGHPVMRMATPVAGFCKTRGFQLANANARASELLTIGRYMDSGVFIE